ncbi:hypothetical protein Pla22_24040 [Rubripirellula amarantea]|uniref:Uncharacterized protein n=1 Tax=Rubripirellula amarantea TaxID=2527999 RepID=A0A5C5WXZ3_9BACT|nr:hypothetical protein [Rubripirellula amarantea]TWT54752.1 hypothetical protein Pla22_24040 [Rubripirellula amarantea]
MKTHSSLPIGDQPPPAFGCIVYVRALDGGKVAARVMNLDGFEVEASNEREAMSKLVPLFRTRVKEMHESGEEIPWIESYRAPDEGEVKRFLPVHL